MKLLKLITAYCMFSHASLMPAETGSSIPVLPELSEKDQSAISKPSETQTKPEEVTAKQDTADAKPIEKKEDIKEKNDQTKWQEHLKTLLVKGAFWDSSSNSPTSDWISSAETIAEDALTKDTSQADELKTSFASTINEKFLTIEKGTNIVPIAALINEFNKKIDDLVKKLSDVKTTEEKQPESKEETPTPTETTIPETSSEEATPIEKTAKEQEKKDKKLKQQWLDCLESIKSEGTSFDEVVGMVDEISLIVEQLVEQFPLEINSLKGEFLDALKERHGKALIQFNEQSVRRITNIFDGIETSQKKPSFDTQTNETAPSTPSSTPEMKQPIQPSKVPTKQKTQLRNTQTIIIQQEGKDNLSAIAAEKFAADQRAQAQKSLAAKMQKAAQQKVESEKADAQRGILSSIAKAILPESWTGANEAEKTIKSLLNDQIKEVEKLIDNSLSDDDKNKIKVAYELFQKTVLDFNSKDYWNDKEMKPNQAWIKKMTMPSIILIKNNIISLDTIKQILMDTFGSMPVKKHKIIEAEFIAAIKKEEEKQRELYLAEQKKQQKLEEEKRKEIENERLEKQRKQQALLDQERANIEQKQRKEINKKAAFDTFEHLKDVWVELLTEISHNKSATAEQNEAWTADALKITQDMLQLVPVMGTNNQQEIISKHKIDFSKALLAQGNNDPKVNIYGNMDKFNEKVYTFIINK